ncbi:hypothetical protein AX774_g5756 [Zancudomyces culisetae]|uniref:Uncharacterized protein n=1 Tax=Zancudomyces culisetae TaxID=1213189 RepID=A0A1R1PIW4_ZANCU|nr:hypothetical protein AX774_g5756 [Zancudomyces culisetae]|eukprot:OMH80792.1 hypothetical protein AX774_g5756 [Zancudomyces culisetae]
MVKIEYLDEEKYWNLEILSRYPYVMEIAERMEEIKVLGYLENKPAKELYNREPTRVSLCALDENLSTYFEALVEYKNMNYTGTIEKLACSLGVDVCHIMELLGNSMFMLGKLNDSLSYYSRILVENEYGNSCLDKYVHALQLLGKVGELEEVNSKLALNGNNTYEHHVARARMYLLKNDWDNVVGYAQKAHALDSDRSEPYLLLSKVEIENGNYLKAKEYALLAHRKDASSRTFLVLIETLILNSEFQYALLLAKQLAFKTKNSGIALTAMAIVLSHSSECFESSVALLKRVMDMEPGGNIEAEFALFSIYVSREMYTEAIDLMKGSVGYNSCDAVHSKLGDVYTLCDDFECAIEEYNKSLALNPYYKRSQDGLERIKKFSEDTSTVLSQNTSSLNATVALDGVQTSDDQMVHMETPHHVSQRAEEPDDELMKSHSKTPVAKNYNSAMSSVRRDASRNSEANTVSKMAHYSRSAGRSTDRMRTRNKTNSRRYSSNPPSSRGSGTQDFFNVTSALQLRQLINTNGVFSNDTPGAGVSPSTNIGYSNTPFITRLQRLANSSQNSRPSMPFVTPNAGGGSNRDGRGSSLEATTIDNTHKTRTSSFVAGTNAHNDFSVLTSPIQQQVKQQVQCTPINNTVDMHEMYFNDHMHPR